MFLYSVSTGLFVYMCLHLCADIGSPAGETAEWVPDSKRAEPAREDGIICLRLTSLHCPELIRFPFQSPSVLHSAATSHSSKENQALSRICNHSEILKQNQHLHLNMFSRVCSQSLLIFGCVRIYSIIVHTELHHIFLLLRDYMWMFPSQQK